MAETAIGDERLLGTLPGLGSTVLVIGDVMLDVFAYGQAERISPEAPVPVMRLEREAWMPGGAGNVARNVAALGGRAILVGLVGEDASGAALTALVEAEAGIENRLLRSSHRQTTVKQRFVVGSQQMLRVDREAVHALDPAEEAALTAEITRAVAGADAGRAGHEDHGAPLAWEEDDLSTAERGPLGPPPPPVQTPGLSSRRTKRARGHDVAAPGP